MSQMLERVNATTITPELLAGAMEAIADLEQEDRVDLTGRLLAIVKFVSGQADARAEVALAINFRLMALANLAMSGGARGFSHPGSQEGMDWLHADVVRCAAEEPLLDTPDAVIFDPVSFQRRLLKITTPEGSA